MCDAECWRGPRCRYFKPHYDAGFVYSGDERTLFTFIAYLNDDFAGADADADAGATVFRPDHRHMCQTARFGLPAPPEATVVVPRAGSALVFFQAGAYSPRHEGRPHHTKGAWIRLLPALHLVSSRSSPVSGGSCAWRHALAGPPGARVRPSTHPQR